MKKYFGTLADGLAVVVCAIGPTSDVYAFQLISFNGQPTRWHTSDVHYVVDSRGSDDFEDNYDGSEHQPVVLPARFPNLLVNGAGGIAVGMATNMPPHNLGEVVDGCFAYLDNEDITVDELLEIIPGPDFPTACPSKPGQPRIRAL